MSDSHTDTTTIQDLQESAKTVNTRQCLQLIIECWLAGLVPYVKSSPGIGKSSLFALATAQLNLYMIDHRISTSAPEDLTGLPRFTTDENGRTKAEFVPFKDIFPTIDMGLSEEYEGYAIVLDEFNSGQRETIAASYKLVLDKKTGQVPLHERTVIGMAGNKDTDRAITNVIGTAMQSRVITINLKEDYTCWLEDVALPNNYHSMIIAYLSQHTGSLMTFRPDHEDDTFACPRTWEFMNNHLKVDGTVRPDRLQKYAGTIGYGEATRLIQFAKAQDGIVLWRDILADPENAKLPTNPDQGWMIASIMAEQANEETFGAFTRYAKRLRLNMRVLFYRMVMAQKPELREDPAFAQGAFDIQTYLNKGRSLNSDLNALGIGPGSTPGGSHV